MRVFGLMFSIAAAALAVSSATIEQEAGSGFGGLGLRAGHRGKGRNTLRGKGAVSRPKKRQNMRHVSKRVRRKHRRAA